MVVLLLETKRPLTRTIFQPARHFYRFYHFTLLTFPHHWPTILVYNECSTRRLYKAFKICNFNQIEMFYCTHCVIDPKLGLTLFGKSKYTLFPILTVKLIETNSWSSCMQDSRPPVYIFDYATHKWIVTGSGNAHNNRRESDFSDISLVG